MQSLGQNAGLQQGMPPIMSPSHASSNYGAYQPQQPFPQSAGGSLMQHGEMYQMHGQHSSSYFGGANYQGYGGGYQDQSSKQQAMQSSAGYQSNYQQPDSFGSAGSLQNFGQYDAPPLSPSQHQPPMQSPSTMLPGMMHSGSSFSYGSIPRAPTSSSMPQQMQMQASSFQGNLQHPPSSPSYSQMQMTSPGNMSVGSAGYPTYGGSARTQSSPVPQQSIALSSTFPTMSPPSPKQMHHPGRTLTSPVLQQMQPMGSQNNHPLRSPGPGSQLSRRSAASPLAPPNSSPPPLTGLVRRSPTPVQQMYPGNVGGNTAAPQLSPQHSQYPPPSPLQQQLSCMYGWGSDVPAATPLPSPTQLRHLQQQVIDGSFQNDESPGATQQTRPWNARSVIQPTGKMPSPVSRKPTGGSALARKHSAGVTAPNIPSPTPKVPKLDNNRSPPKHVDSVGQNNFKSTKGDSPSKGSPNEPKEKSLLDKKRPVVPNASNGMSPSEIGIAQLKGSVSGDESNMPIPRDMAHIKGTMKQKSSDATTVEQGEKTEQTAVNDQQNETVRSKAGGDTLSGDSLLCRKPKNHEHAEESRDASKTKSGEQLIRTEKKTESLQDMNAKSENRMHGAAGKLEDHGNKETFGRAVTKQSTSKQEVSCTPETDQKLNKALIKSDEVLHKDDCKNETKEVEKPHMAAEGAQQKQVKPEDERQFQEATHKSDVPEKSKILLETVKQSESDNKVETSKKVSKEIEEKETLHKTEKLNESAQPEKKEDKILCSEYVENLEKPLVNDEKPHNSIITTEDNSADVDTSKEDKQVPKDVEEAVDGQTEIIKTGEKSTQSSTKSSVDVKTETTPQVKLSKSSDIQSVVVTSVAGGTSALSGTTAITASVIAKGQAQGTGQQVLVAKTPTGQMYLIQGNVLIPVQNVQVQQEKGKHGSKVIVVNPASGSKHTTFKTTSTVTKLTTSTATVDSQKYSKSPGKSKPLILYHSSDKKLHTATTPSTHKKGPGDTQKGSSEKVRDRPSTISTTSKERLKEKVVGNLDAKIKVIEQTGKQSESKLVTQPTATSCKGSPTLSASGKRIGRPLGSKDKQKRKRHSHKKSVSEHVNESASFVVKSEMSPRKSPKGRPRRSESEKLTPQKTAKRTLASDVPTVGYSSESRKKVKYSTPLPGIKFISVRPKGCAVGDPWCCCLCGKAPHHGYLGVLFGPYRAKLISREIKDSISKTSKSPTSKLLSPTNKSKQMSTEGSVAEAVNETEAPMLELWVHKDCVTWSHGVYMQGRSLEGLEQAVESATQHVSTSQEPPSVYIRV